MKKILVTGGGGFVGSAIVKLLLDKGYQVIVLGRNRYEHIEQRGATCLVGDIADNVFVDKALKGVETVYHTAAKAGIWGSWNDYRIANVIGTKNVVNSCRSNRVKNLIYTSTPSVVFNSRDIENGNEQLPYATKFLCNYSKSKVLAERFVLGANSDQLKTTAIRPHLIWGPGDPHLLPRIIERGRNGQLKIIGSGNNKVDITYIDNVAYAHLLAHKSLEKNGKAAGKAYFIGQERPVNLWDWINGIYGELDIPLINKKITFGSAYFAGMLLEWVYNVFPFTGEPKMTRFLATQLACSHYFSHDCANRDLGYVPLITLEEGQKQLINWLESQ